MIEVKKALDRVQELRNIIAVEVDDLYKECTLFNKDTSEFLTEENKNDLIEEFLTLFVERRVTSEHEDQIYERLLKSVKTSTEKNVYSIEEKNSFEDWLSSTYDIARAQFLIGCNHLIRKVIVRLAKEVE